MTMNGVMIPWVSAGSNHDRRQRDVNAPRHLALRGGGDGRGDREQSEQGEGGNYSEMAQGLPPQEVRS